MKCSELLRRGFRILRKNYEKKQIEMMLPNLTWRKFETCATEERLEDRFLELLEHSKTLHYVEEQMS